MSASIRLLAARLAGVVLVVLIGVGLVAQDRVVEQADEMGLELMTDDATGEIIIMDAKDAAKFVNLLNDDYMTSDMTGIKYELKGKKELRGDSGVNTPEGE